MAGDESAAEELVELGIEIVNPGGRPDVLRDAAKAWRKLQKDLAGDGGVLAALEKDVSSTVGETWRGESAEAFQRHWKEFKAAVEESVEEFDEVAGSLDEAADAIEECNDEIHQIYLEIGVTAAVGVATSFFSFGLTGAAAAANIARLAAQAVRIAGRLGTILRKIGTAFRALANVARAQRALSGLKALKNLSAFKKLASGKHLTNLAVNAGANTAGNVVTTAVANGGTVTPRQFADAAWQGVGASVFGTGVGMKAGSMVAGKVSSKFAARAAEGVTGNVVGGVAVDGIRAGVVREEGMTAKTFLYDALGNSIAGVAGAGAMKPVDAATGPRSSPHPHMAVEGVVGSAALSLGGTSKDKLASLEEDFG